MAAWMSLTIRVTPGSSSIRLSRVSFMLWLPICGNLITFMVACRTTVRGADRARRAATRALPTPIGFAPAAAMVFTRKPIRPITTSSIPNRRTARCHVWIYAPGAALAFVRAPPRPVVVAAEAVVAAVAVNHNPEPARRRRRNQLRIRKRPSPRRQPLPALAALAQTSRPLQTWCRRLRRESSIAFTGTPPS